MNLRQSIGLEKRISIADEHWDNVATLVTSLEESGGVKKLHSKEDEISPDN